MCKQILTNRKDIIRCGEMGYVVAIENKMSRLYRSSLKKCDCISHNGLPYQEQSYITIGSQACKYSLKTHMHNSKKPYIYNYK